jgi:hypothetical protein
MRDVSTVGDLEFFSTMAEMFGTRRCMELAGWAIRWGMTGEIDDLKAVRQRLLDQGLSRTAVYRALTDFRLLRERLEASENHAISNIEFLRRFGVSVAYAEPVVL